MAATFFARGKMGLDGNRPMDVQTGALVSQFSNPSVFSDVGTAFVRVNMVLGPWSSPQDTTQHAGRTWFQAYDAIVNGLLARNVQVYALVGSEATSPADPGDRFRTASPNPDADTWIQAYATNFRAIVAHFADRVKVYESFNEPNDWHGGTGNWIHPYWFAKMLRQLYKAVKIDGGHKVTLVSGPLLTHDLPGGGDDGATYLDQTYRQGRSYHAWEQFQADYGTYPLDDVGYHMYLAEGATATTADIQAIYTRYLNAITTIIKRYEGDLTEKGLHVSEYGWSSDNGEDRQARNMETGFRLLRDHVRVKTASWFCLQDFPSRSYGVYRAGALSNANRKPAYTALYNLMAESVPQARVGYDAQGKQYPAIVAAYQRAGGEAALGQPFDNGGSEFVHRWGNGVVQDFKTPAGTMTLISLRDGASTAYVVGGVIRHRFIYTYGGVQGPLGYPKSDVTKDEWDLPQCSFEKGTITCRTYTEFIDE